jgi:outer membrane protein
MKRIISLVLLSLLCGLIFAEDKMAYIDTDKIMMLSSETQEAQSILIQERQKWDKEINDLDVQLDQLYADYESKKMILSQSGKQEAEQKIMDLTDQRQAKVREIYGEQGKFVQKQSELLEPILKKLQTVIEKVAVENNYTVIFDAAAGGLLYAKPNLDITDTILQELEKSVETTGK